MVAMDARHLNSAFFLHAVLVQHEADGCSLSVDVSRIRDCITDLCKARNERYSKIGYPTMRHFCNKCTEHKTNEDGSESEWFFVLSCMQS